MIRFTGENGNLEIVAETRGYNVYLDNDSVIDIANGSAPRRQRFVNALRSKGTLLFSWANAVEIAGPQGRSADAVRAFLDSVGPAWVPLESNAWEVAWREAAGLTSGVAVSEHFMRVYFEERAAALLPEGGPVDDLPSGSFFRLGAVLDWVQQNREEVRTYSDPLDDALGGRLGQLGAEYARDTSSLDRLLPSCHFDFQRPATFVLVHLQRLLVREAKAYRFMPHDGLDFCHAVMAAAYGSVIALDKQWKRRVEVIPSANQLARTYYRPELDKLICTLESLSSP
ncbi:MAG: hypothetical protein V3R42_04230 [candidate division NC10 bacterium]